MKILKSSHINPFGGLNFVLQEFENKKIGKLLEEHLPQLPTQCKYSWKDIVYSFWSVYFCGGDCVEDLGGNFPPLFPSMATARIFLVAVRVRKKII